MIVHITTGNDIVLFLRARGGIISDFSTVVETHLWCIHTARQRDRDWHRNRYIMDRIQWESVFLSISVQYEHLKILVKPVFSGLGVGQCKHQYLLGGIPHSLTV